jgi:hypothetical protein
MRVLALVLAAAAALAILVPAVAEAQQPWIVKDRPRRGEILTTVGQPTTLAVTGFDGQGDLRGSEWWQGNRMRQQRIAEVGGSGTAARFSQTYSFAAPGVYTVNARTFDAGSRYSAALVEWQVRVVPRGRALYVDRVHELLVDACDRAALVSFVQRQGISRVVLYNLLAVNDQGLAGELVDLTEELRAAGVAWIGAAIGDHEPEQEAILDLLDAGERVFDGLVTEVEFWWAADRAAAFADYLDLLASLRWLAAGRGLTVAAYLGFFSASEADALAGLVDEAWLTYYRGDPTDVYHFVYDSLGALRQRLVELGEGRQAAPVRVAPLFHGGPGEEGEGMGPWLAGRDLAAAEAHWFADLAGDRATRWRAGVEIVDSVWFAFHQLLPFVEPDLVCP